MRNRTRHRVRRFPCFTSFQRCTLGLPDSCSFPASSGLRLLVTGESQKGRRSTHAHGMQAVQCASVAREEIFFPSRSNKYFSSGTKPVRLSSSFGIISTSSSSSSSERHETRVFAETPALLRFRICRDSRTFVRVYSDAYARTDGRTARLARVRGRYPLD